MKKVQISIKISQPVRKIILGSLSPETGRIVPKTHVKIKETNMGVLLEIEAETTNALRAALNSYFRWLNCIFSIATELDKST